MMEPYFYTNPFFWALISMLGMVGATSLFSIHKLRRNGIFVSIVLILVTVGRFVLPLPFCAQPRFEIGGMHWIIGGIIVAIGLAVGAGPVIGVRWWSPPKAGMKLKTSGIYGIVRHPIYLCEVLWPLGMAIMFCSVYGVFLTPVWWLAFLIHALAEEANLRRELGDEYIEYEKKVRGRIFPGLPF
jgi:protein-S-isoprenylcysteine O-methyltransferase Ste14